VRRGELVAGVIPDRGRTADVGVRGAVTPGEGNEPVSPPGDALKVEIGRDNLRFGTGDLERSGRAFYASLRLPAREITGVAVLESEQPAVWSAVRRAAVAAGTAPPEFLWIDSRFNAAVFEQTRWLGLRAGPRHLVIGAPMLIAFSPAKLDAVLGHEFGHFAHRDTRLLPVIMRGRAGLAGALNTASFFTPAL
jgi:hypothetical protein